MKEVARGLQAYQKSFEVEGVSQATAMAKMAKFAERVPEFIGKARFTESTKIHSTGETADQTRNLEHLREAQAEANVVAMDIRKTALDQFKLEKEVADAAERRAREERQARQAERLRQMQYRNVPLGF